MALLLGVLDRAQLLCLLSCADPVSRSLLSLQHDFRIPLTIKDMNCIDL